MSFSITYCLQTRQKHPTGDCIEASAASILYMDPTNWRDSVPDLFTGDESIPRSEDRQELFNNWLYVKYRLTQVMALFRPRNFPFNWYNIGDESGDISFLPFDHQCYIMLGETNEDEPAPHAVVGRRDSVLWDPSPDGPGLKNVNGVIFFLNEVQFIKAFSLSKWRKAAGQQLVFITGEEDLNPYCPYDSKGLPKR